MSLLKLRSNSFSHIKAVLFDLDGTLVDSAPDLGMAANKMRIDRGMSILPLWKYRPWVGAGARGMIFVAFGLTPDSLQFSDLKEEFFSNYQEVLAVDTRIFDQIEPVISVLIESGLKWAVVTNKSQRFTTPLTATMSLFKTAGAIVSGDTTAHSKPHPAPLLFAATQLGVDAANCIYVGDDERDILAGKAAKMMTVAAAYGYLGEGVDCRSWNADAIINSPADLKVLLNLRRVT